MSRLKREATLDPFGGELATWTEISKVSSVLAVRKLSSIRFSNVDRRRSEKGSIPGFSVRFAVEKLCRNEKSDRLLTGIALPIHNTGWV